jgi:hypothetical protein
VRPSGSFASIASRREGAASKGARPLSERTYAVICQTWSSGMRPRNDGMPFGLPSTMVAKMFCGALP